MSQLIHSLRVNEPILLAGYDNAATMTTATFTGNVEQSQVSIRLSDRFGNGSSAHYSFVLTNGDGEFTEL